MSKYQLEQIRRDLIEKKLVKMLRDPSLRKIGLVNASTFQVHVVSLRQGQSKVSDQALELPETPLSVLDPYRKSMSDETYFQAVLMMNRMIAEYRDKHGAIPKMPDEIRCDVVYLNRLQVTAKACDSQGNCLMVVQYKNFNLREILQRPLD